MAQQGGPGDPSYKQPNLWQSYWNKVHELFWEPLPNAGVIIVGRGNERYELKPYKTGYVGVWKVGSSQSLMTILDFRTGTTVWDTGMGALGIYDKDPRNRWTGPFLDRLYEWNPVPGKDGLYFNVGNPELQDYYYEYRYDPDLGHTMFPKVKIN